MIRRPLAISPLVMILMCLVVLDSGSNVSAAGALECTVASLQPKAPGGTTVTAAVAVEASGKMPQYCKVDGFVATPGNTVNFRLGLPATWNGKFYFQGVGGFAGAIGPLNTGLERGYASASTDTGHQAAGTDASWALNNPAKKIDYGYRGVHVTAVAAKSLSHAYYGTAPRYSYFNGCSNGGRQALMEAQRYPEDFEGIIGGDPSFGSLSTIRRTSTYQPMLSSSEHFLPAAKLELISKAVLASCDAQDGLADGLITDPRACHFQPETLKCAGVDGPTCLTTGQLDTLKKIYADVQGPSGQVLHGFPVGHQDGPTGWQLWITGAVAPARRSDGTTAFEKNPPTGFAFLDGYLRYLMFEVDDPSFDWRTFSLERHGSKLEAMMKIFNPTDSDLTKLQNRGAKLLLYHGWADPALSAYDTVAYYDRVVKVAGGQPKADQFVKLFMVPGMHHCGGGPGPNTFDMLTPLENWVERGAAPTRVVASHAANGIVDRTRPLCPHPQVARYAGAGSIDAAENFRCEPPGPSGAQR